MPKNAQAAVQLFSFHMLARLCWKSFKLGFSSTWTEKLKMYKLDLEMVEDPRSNCQHSLDHEESKGVPEKPLFLLYWLCQSLWLCGSPQTVENSERDGNTDHLTCLLSNQYAGQEATVRTGHGTTDWFQIGKGGCILSRLYTVTLLI